MVFGLFHFDYNLNGNLFDCSPYSVNDDLYYDSDYILIRRNIIYSVTN